MSCVIIGVGSQHMLRALRKKAHRVPLPRIGPPMRKKSGFFWEDRLQRFALPFPGSDARSVVGGVFDSVVVN